MNDPTEIAEALKHSEDRLRLALEATGLGTWDWAPQSGLLVWDDRCRAAFGLPPGAPVDYDVFLAGLHPDDRGRVDLCVRRALDPAGERGYDVEYRTIGPSDGVERRVAARGRAYFDDAGRAVRFIGTVRDVSADRRDEAVIAEQARLAELGREAGVALSESTTLREMLTRAAALLVRHLDAAFARVWTLDEAGQYLELRASAGMYTHIDGPHGRIPLGRFKIGMIARERTPHLTNAVVGDPRVGDQDWARREGMVAFAGYPLVVEGRLVGVVALFARHRLSDSALRAIETMARGLAVGIEKARAEERLRDQEEWLRVTLTSIGDAVIATDGRGRVRFMNPVAEALTGWAQPEAAGRPLGEVFRIVNEETRRPVESPVDRVLREGVVAGLANHTVLIGRGGAEAAIDDSAAPIRDGRGAVVGVVMTFRDVGAARAAEARLRQSEGWFRRLADAMPQIVWTARPDGHLDYYNERWYEYSGFPRGGTGDPSWQPILHPDDLAGCRDAWGESLRSSTPYQIEFRLFDRFSGLHRWHLARALPVRDEAGRVVKWFGTCTDVDDYKNAEAALRAARDEAEHANRAKDQFLAVLSHELRTPLNPILLAVTSMLEQPRPAEDARPDLELIRRYVNLQARLIDDLLDVMRIVRGKMPLHWEVADGHALIHQAAQICRSEVLGKGLRLELDLAAPRRHISTDPARLQQVFWNLIQNAAKFTAEGAVTVRTRNEPGPDGLGDVLVIEVSDTGIGIDPEALPRIFDPFQQGETSITRRFGGMGLGLAICRGIVEGHGGVLRASSPGPHRGSTFRIELACLPEPEVAEAGPPPAELTSQGALPPAAAATILLVEDEPSTLRLMARLLRGLGHEVVAAGTVAAALEAARSRPFDLIVSDIGLPDGTGLDLIRRAVALLGPVPAIALTGYGMEEDVRRSREAGFHSHLTKPIDFAKLEMMIRRLIGNSARP